MPTTHKGLADGADVSFDVRHTEALLKTGALQSAIFNSAHFSSIATESLVDLGLFPPSRGQTLKVLIVDDDSKAVELIAVGILGLAGTVLRVYGGRQAIDAARLELPDVIVLDLMMPDVTGFDVVAALNERPDTARIPIIVVTAKQITDEDRERLSVYVTTIVEKGAFDADRFTAEVRRAMSGRGLVA